MPTYWLLGSPVIMDPTGSKASAIAIVNTNRLTKAAAHVKMGKNGLKHT